MSASVNIQQNFRCTDCKSAADIYGRCCKHGDMFPLLLLISGKETCPNFELDTDKVKQQLKEMERKK